MDETRERIVAFVKSKSLPENPLDIIGGLLSRDQEKFESQEGTYWDYKREFPFSLSDDYFGGIIRLVCAFHNSYGGIFIFGIHDRTRDAGHNKVNINIEDIIKTTVQP